jgi:hypothetical protein
MNPKLKTQHMEYYLVATGDSLRSFTQPEFEIENDNERYKNSKTLIQKRLISYMRSFYEKRGLTAPPEVNQIEKMILEDTLNYGHWGSIKSYRMSGQIMEDESEIVVRFDIKKLYKTNPVLYNCPNK